MAGEITAREAKQHAESAHHRISRLDKSIDDLWKRLDVVQNRLPVMATFGFSFLTFIIGILIRMLWVK